MWYCYAYAVGLVVKHRGITRDPQRRELEHRQRWPGGKLHVLHGPITEARARAWEMAQALTVTPERR